MNTTLGKVLVIRGGAIGDFILTLPVLSALRRQFPRAHLEVLGYPHIVQLALAGGLVHQVKSIEARALAGFFARHGPLDQSLARYFESFSVILSYLYDPDEIFRSNVARCAKAQFIAGPHRPVETSDVHATEVFLRPLEQLAIFNADPVPRLALIASSPPNSGGRASPRALAENSALRTPHSAIKDLDAPEPRLAPRQWLALHPGSGSERKNWPEENWAEFLGRLAKSTDFKFLLIGGEAEGDRLTRLAAVLPGSRIRLAQDLTLVELAFQLQQCRAYVGHDSGISHLAAAVGLEGLILWGSTNWKVWGPRSERMKILHGGDGLGQLPAERVLEEMGTLVKKR